MAKFGKYAVIDPITHTFEKEPQWWWKIKPPTSGDELSMSKFMVSGRVEMNVDGVRREFPPTSIEVAHREIALTFAGTNVPVSEQSVEEGGKAMIETGMRTEEVEAILRQMPHDMILEIWAAIGDSVPGWGAYRPKGQKSSES
jgi:hypothetical protein